VGQLDLGISAQLRLLDVIGLGSGKMPPGKM